MRPIRFSLGNRKYVAVSEFDVRTISDPTLARRVARAILDAERRDRVDERDIEAHERRLADRILSGEVAVVRLEEKPRLLDAPNPVELASLAEAEPTESVVEPPRPTAWVGVRVVDQRGRPVSFFDVQVDDPTGKRHQGSLDAGARGSVGDLAEDGGCIVTLTPLPGDPS